MLHYRHLLSQNPTATLLGCICLLLLAVPQPLSAQALSIETRYTGLNQPVDLAFAQGSAYDYLVERGGRIRLGLDGEILPEPFADLRARVNDSGGEQGLLGLALAPDFPSDPSVFVYYTNAAGSVLLSRFEASSTTELDPASETVLLLIEQPFANHNGGSIQFGPDNYLYVASGDGGSGGDPLNKAQDLGSLLGKILRLDVLSEPGEAVVPADNPFRDVDGALDEIWSYGWRNPWRHSFDPLTGDMWIADVGQDAREEVDVEPAGSPGGLNYGWRCREGDLPFNMSGDCDGPFVEPVHTYQTLRFGGDGCSISGGAVYRGELYPALRGRYVYTDFCSGKVFTLTPDGQDGYVNALGYEGPSNSYAAIRQGRDGELYILDISGRVERIVDNCASELTGELTIGVPSCLGLPGSAFFASDRDDVTLVYSSGDEGPDAPELAAGSYVLTITGPDSCQRQIAFDVPEGEALEVADIGVDSTSGEDLVLVAPEGFSRYDWYLDDSLLFADAPARLSITQPGRYAVVVSDERGCQGRSAVVDIVEVTAIREPLPDFALSLYPNPAAGSTRASAKWSSIAALRVYDVQGRVALQVLRTQLPAQDGVPYGLDVSELQPGLHLVVPFNGEGRAGQSVSLTIAR